VPLCALYGAWSLLGGGARLRVRRWLAARPLLPDVWSRRLQRAGSASHGCDCDGCDNAGHATKGAPSPRQAIVQVHRRRP
jgi:hypothetical protein